MTGNCHRTMLGHSDAMKPAPTADDFNRDSDECARACTREE
jgi:hypothetical protein